LKIATCFPRKADSVPDLRALANDPLGEENKDKGGNTIRIGRDKGMASPSKTKGLIDDAGTLRDEWLRRLFDLTRLVRRWAEQLDWSTRQIEKRMKDSRLGVYEAPALIMQKGTTRVLLDPVARFAPGSDGVVDLYLMPAYDDIVSLFFVAVEWRMHYTFPRANAVATTKESEPVLLSKETLAEVLSEMSSHASSTP